MASNVKTGTEAGAVPLPEDMADLKAAGKRCSDGGSPSPTRQRADTKVSLDIETLRGLLAEQSATLLDNVMQAQKDQMSAMASELRQEMKSHNEALRSDIRKETSSQAAVIQELKTNQQDVLARLQKLENGSPGASTMEPINLERHRFTLIFGGWSKDTARNTITSQLHQALQDQNLTQCTDNPGFTTGPRRSVALMQFRIRAPHEDYQGMRERMQQIVGKISRTTTIVKGGSKLWCGFSKSKADRDRGSHAALIRRTVRAIAPDREPDLETEYGSGSTWLGDFKFSSASVPADGLDRSKILEYDPLCPGGPHPWVDLGAMAECLEVGIERLKETIKGEQRR